MSAITTVVLDLDGTLFDHVGAARRGVERWLGEEGVALTPELFDRWLAVEQRHVLHWREGRISWTEQRRRRLQDFLPLVGLPVGTAEELDEAFASGYLRAYEQAWTAFPDAHDAVLELQAAGLRTAVLTNGAESQQRAKLSRIDLLDRIGAVFTAEGLGVAKPDPAAYRAVCERLGVRPDEVLHVGDDHDLDVLGARAAGLQAVLLDREDAHGEERARIRSLRNLPAFASARR